VMRSLAGLAVCLKAVAASTQLPHRRWYD
jgi:hypothetical protein